MKTRLLSYASVHLSKIFLASLLDNCSKVLSLRKLHARMTVCGLRNSHFLDSKLLYCYVKLNLVHECRRVLCTIVSDDLSLWRYLLVGCYRAGNHEEVVVGYLDLKRQRIGLCGSVITVVLKSCVDIGRFEFGRNIHVDAFKVNLNSDCFVGSSLVKLYSKANDVESASKLFDEIVDKDTVAYTSMITAYAQCNLSAYKAFHVSHMMQNEKLQLNRVTLVSLLQAAVQLGGVELGRAIHGYAIRQGIGMQDEIFYASLMDMYHKCGRPQMAAFIFGKMEVRRICSWNTMIAAYLHMGQYLEAIKLFCQMVHENIFPDLLTLANAILSCTNLSYLLQGKSIHGYMIRVGLEPDLIASTALIDLYSKFDVTKARKMFESLGNKDAALCNVMMAGFLQNELFLEVIKVFNEMVKISVQPNVGSYLNLLSAVSNLRNFKIASSIHGYLLRNGFLVNVEIVNQIINTYANCGHMLHARRVFNCLRYRDLISWTSMMRGYVYNGHHYEAIVLFRLMQKENLNLDSISLTSLIQALSLLGILSSVKEVHCLIYKGLLGSDLFVINSLLTAYAKCGRIDIARCMFDQIVDPCLTTWNAMIGAYGIHGKCADVLKLFEQMKSVGVKPDEVTFTSLLTACSHSGLVEDGLQVYKTMVQEYFIVPREVHYLCMIDLLSRSGLLKEAYNLVKIMPRTPDSSAWRSLLSACRLYGDTDICEVIVKQMLELEPNNLSLQFLVSNMFAEKGKWEEAAQIRVMVRSKGLRKSPGFSLIELDKQQVT